MASGNVVRRACFRILFLSCDVWSADVHGTMSLSRAIVTRSVTHLDLERLQIQRSQLGGLAREKVVCPAGASSMAPARARPSGRRISMS